MPEILKKTEVTTRKSPLPDLKGKWYTDDELSNMILDEYKNFKASLDQQIRESFEHNYKLAQAACEELYQALRKDLKVNCKSIHLRFTSTDTFDAITQIPYKDFLSLKFDESFSKSSAISQKFNNSKFFIEFHFMPTSKKINNSSLVSDGYYMTYKNVDVNKKTVSRKA